MTLADLSRSWREEGGRLRDRYARLDLAALCEAHAVELEEAIQAAEDELLPPAQAVPVSGSSARTLRDHVAKGTLKNYGKRGAPLYRRGDLPRRRAQGAAGGFDPHEHVAEIVRSS